MRGLTWRGYNGFRSSTLDRRQLVSESGKWSIRFLERKVNFERKLFVPVGAPPGLAHYAVTLLRRRQVEFQTGYARSTLYLRITQGLWPRPVRLGIRAVGWPAGEVAALNGARIAGLSDAQIRTLVNELVAARRTSDNPIPNTEG